MTSLAKTQDKNSGVAYASFSIRGDQVRPEFWSSYFDIEPDIFVEKGKPFKTPSGRMSRGAGRTSVWGYSSAKKVGTTDLNEHIIYLIDNLGLNRTGLAQMVDNQGGTMRFFCYWDKNILKHNPIIADEVRKQVSQIGAVIDLDIWDGR